MEEENQISVDVAPPKKKIIQYSVLVIVAIVFTVGICIGIGTNFFERAYYEVQNQLTQEVKIHTGTYVGETDFGIFTGSGTFTFQSGEFYEGAWQNYQMEGIGELSYPDGGHYSGGFSKSMKCGQGTFTWDNGDIYNGQWENDAMNGTGTYIFSDGSRMDGEFLNNVFYSGEYVLSNNTGDYTIQYSNGEMISATVKFTDGSVYIGEFSDCQINGNGQIIYPNGDTYTGEYKNGKRNGSGTYEWSFGDTFFGDWNSDAMDGTGTYTFASGVILTGEFSDNKFVSGTYKTDTETGDYIFTLEDEVPVAVELALKSGLAYNGGFSNGKFDGQGKIIYATGETYEGSFVNGLRSGEGIYEWTDGASYSGEWSEDMMNGSGTYYYPTNADGYKLVGTFVDGKPNGECTYYVTSSLSYSTTWNNGKCTKVTE